MWLPSAYDDEEQEVRLANEETPKSIEQAFDFKISLSSFDELCAFFIRSEMYLIYTCLCVCVCVWGVCVQVIIF